MIGVVDTSALIPLFVPDGPLPNDFEGFLRGVERGINIAIAPELLLAEVANVINKKQLTGELSKSESDKLHRMCSRGVLPRVTIPARSCLAWQAGWRSGFVISMT
jgi:predicted nucleic acid-binding protein